jgi:hypothetical protein
MTSFGQAASPFTPQRTLAKNPSRYLDMVVHVTRTEVVRNQRSRTIQIKYVQKYIYHKFRPDPVMVGFIAVWERTPQLQHFCERTVQINPNIDREIKYLDFVIVAT